jgi:hypothetical protein
MSLSGLVALLASTASAQVYQTGDRAEDAFTWIQPEDTVILGQYGHSEAVYPSRMSKVPILIDNRLTKHPSPHIWSWWLGRCTREGQSLRRRAHPPRKGRNGDGPARSLRRKHLPHPETQLQRPLSSGWTGISSHRRLCQRLPCRSHHCFVLGQADDIRPLLGDGS